MRIANDTKYGLFATVWTGDPARGHRLARRIKSGMVAVNHPYTAFPGIPFGGYKQSGFGRELGLETLELCLETKSVSSGPRRSRRTRSGFRGGRCRSVGGPGRGRRSAGELLDVHARAARDRAGAARGLRARTPRRRSPALGGRVGLTIGLLPWGLATDRIGERRALGIGLSTCGVFIAPSPSRSRPRRRAPVRGRLPRRERPVGERSGGHAVVPSERARPRVRGASDRGPGRRPARRARRCLRSWSPRARRRRSSSSGGSA